MEPNKKMINKVALKHIPYKKIKTNSNLYEHPKPTLSPLYKQLKIITSIKKSATNTDITLPYNLYIKKYSNNTLLLLSYQLFLNANPNQNTIPILLNNKIKNLKNTIQKEKKDQTLLEIQNKLQERDNNFTQNPKLFFRKTLEKPNNSVNLDRLLSNNNLTTQPKEIKLALNNHFQDYFKELPYTSIDTNSPFSDLYKPHPENEHLFQNLLSEITSDEWSKIIKELSNNKAAGPSETNYKHIKMLNSKSQNIICLFFSKYLF